MDMKKIINLMTVFIVGFTAICAYGSYGTPLFQPYMLALSAWIIVMLERLFPTKHE